MSRAMYGPPRTLTWLAFVFTPGLTRETKAAQFREHSIRVTSKCYHSQQMLTFYQLSLVRTGPLQHTLWLGANYYAIMNSLLTLLLDGVKGPKVLVATLRPRGHIWPFGTYHVALGVPEESLCTGT